MKLQRLLLLSLLLFLFSTSYSQLINADKGMKKEDQATFEEGEFWFEQLNFHAAYEQYKKLIDRYPNENILLFRIGVCELHFNDKWESSLAHFLKMDYEKNKKSDFPFFLACAYHYNQKFDQAIEEFNKFLSSKYGTKEMKEEARFYLKNCENGKELRATPVDVAIVNIGPPVNTPNSEYVPLISVDESHMYFTYRGERSIGGKQFTFGKKNASEGEYYEDIMVSTKDITGEWSEPILLDSNINTNGNDACVSLSNDAQTLLMFRSTPGDLGTLYKTHLEGDKWSDPELIPGDVNTPFWEGSISISPNGTIAYFASERKGGKGGRDIWRAHKMKDGSWGRITNAGDSINTQWDDDAPFYHPSGQYLLICSRGHKSMGGFDIFRCDRINDTTWTKPINLGWPINTPGEDIYYTLTADGKRGYYSSGKAGGAGLQDIYVVEPGLPGIKVKLLQITGIVTLNDKPAGADIDITFTNTGDNYMMQKSNSISGKYLSSMPAGNEFTMKYKLPGIDAEIKQIDTRDIDDYVERTVDVKFYTQEYLAKKQRERDSIAAIAAKVDPPKNVNEQYGNSSAEGLVFRVQIGAYNFPNNFRYNNVKKLSKVEKIKLDDNITRFVMGTFMTYNEAKVFRDKVIEAGITDAFITAIYKNKRTYITELVQMGVFK